MFLADSTHRVIKTPIDIGSIYGRVECDVLPVLPFQFLKVIVMWTTEPEGQTYIRILNTADGATGREQSACFLLVAVGELAELSDCQGLLLNVVLCEQA